jgi:DNA-binding CsgD family transcriptional regulator
MLRRWSEAPRMDEQILELERLMADVVDFNGVSTQLLGPLQRLCSASDSLLFAFPVGAPPAVLGGSLEEAMRTYSDDLFQEDLIQKYCYSLPAGTYTTGDLRGLDVRGFCRSRPYVDFYRPNRIGFIRGVWPNGLAYGRPGMFGLFVCKPTMEPFDSSVDRSLRHLERPMRAMARRIARFEAVSEERDALHRLLEHQRGAYVLWDRDGRAVWRSSGASAHLEQPELFEELQRAASEARRQAQELGTVPLRRSLLGRPHPLRSCSGERVVAHFWSISQCGGPWLVAELESPPRLAEGSGLTAAEMRVLRCLGRGLSNKEISAELSISHETAKTHVVRILRKLGVDSRAKAATLIRDAEGGAGPLAG